MEEKESIRKASRVPPPLFCPLPSAFCPSPDCQKRRVSLTLPRSVYYTLAWLSRYLRQSMDGAGEIQPMRLNSEARRAIPESAGLLPEKYPPAMVVLWVERRGEPESAELTCTRFCNNCFYNMDQTPTI